MGWGILALDTSCFQLIRDDENISGDYEPDETDVESCLDDRNDDQGENPLHALSSLPPFHSKQLQQSNGGH